MVGPEPRESAAPLGRQKGHMVDMHDPGEPRAIMTRKIQKMTSGAQGRNRTTDTVIFSPIPGNEALKSQ